MSLHTEPVEQQRSSFDQHLATEDFQNSDTSGMLNPLSPGGVGAASTSGPRTPFRTGEHVNPGPRGIPVSLRDALPAGQWPHRPAAGEGARRPCGLTRACLWASTRKQRIAAKERSTRRSNALFWKFWRPAAQHSTQQHEVVVPTPHGAEQECRVTALKVGEPTRRKPRRLAVPSATSGHQRQRRPRPAAAFPSWVTSPPSFAASRPKIPACKVQHLPARIGLG